MLSSINVLVVGNSQDDLETILDKLNQGSFPVDYRLVSTEQEIQDALLNNRWDLVILETAGDAVSSERWIESISALGFDLPVVVLTNTNSGSFSHLDSPEALYYIQQNHLDALLPMAIRAMKDTEQRREQRRMEKVQAALIDLSRAALMSRSLDELYKTIHDIINELMPANNFYICLYDETDETIWFPYHIDEYDEPTPRGKLDRGLTAYVLRTGKPLLASPVKFEELVEMGEVELVGAPSIDWLGVPLFINQKVIGVIALQSYTEGVRFSNQDLEILLFVSNQVGMAIDRKRAEEALKTESQFRKAIEDSIMAGIIAADLEGRQTYINPAFCRMVGWSEKELLDSEPPYLYWPPDEIETIQKAFQATTGEDALPSDFELVFQRRNGDRFDVYLLVSPLKDGEGRVTGWLASVYDITSRKRDEEAIRRQKARAEALARTAARLNSRLDLQKVLNTVCEETLRALNVSAVSVLIYNPKKELFEFRAGQGWPESASQVMQPISRKLLEMLIGQVDATDVVNDVQAIPDLQNFDLLHECNVQSVAITGMMRDRSIIGCLAAFTFENKRDFSADEIYLLEGLGDVAAQAIANARLFEDLERSLLQVRALNAVEIAINASLDLRVTLNILLDQTISMLNVDAADVWMYNAGAQELEFAVGRGFRLPQPVVLRTRLGNGYSSRVIVERKMVTIQNLASTPEGYQSVFRLPSEGLTAYIGIPLIAKGQVKGVLQIFRRTEFEQQFEWLDILDTLAGQAAIAIDNATLFDQLQRSNEELNQAFDANLEGWVRMLDQRNHESDDHTQNLINLTLALAQRHGLREEEMVNLRRGALLHDIGMIRVPECILLKPGSLTDEEWEVVHQHPNFAIQTLSPIAYLRTAIDIPYCHHERWDGSGYPRQLRQQQIPLAARIFAVADAWVSFRSPRAYRPACEESRALEYLTSQAGILFDPTVVEAFLELRK